jgi:hypothetical protein
MKVYNLAIKYTVAHESAVWACAQMVIRSNPTRAVFSLLKSVILNMLRNIIAALDFTSSSLHGLGESPILASNIVTSPSTFFLVFLCLVYQKDGICRLVVECESVPSFADVFSICLCIL